MYAGCCLHFFADAYKFFVDGRWELDPNNPHREQDGHDVFYIALSGFVAHALGLPELCTLRICRCRTGLQLQFSGTDLGVLIYLKVSSSFKPATPFRSWKKREGAYCEVECPASEFCVSRGVPSRPLYVYLPPSYEACKDRRYPGW